jgi:hypothetical protein
MTTAHTPGPWRVEEGTTLVWGACNPDDSTTRGMGYPILECRITPSGSWAKKPWADEGEANAHLVAALPDLLALAYQYRNDLRHPPSDDSRDRRIAAIDAAIAKATAA